MLRGLAGIERALQESWTLLPAPPAFGEQRAVMPSTPVSFVVRLLISGTFSRC